MGGFRGLRETDVTLEYTPILTPNFKASVVSLACPLILQQAHSLGFWKQGCIPWLWWQWKFAHSHQLQSHISSGKLRKILLLCLISRAVP